MKFVTVLLKSIAMLSLLANAFAEGFAPLPDVTVSQWADKYRFIGKPSPEPGEWRTDRVPYMREIMDRMSPSDPCEICALMKATQGAGTEGGLNFLGCYMHLYPRDMMMVLPTIKIAQKFSRKRLDRMIADTPALRGLVSAPRSRDASNNALLKEFGPGRDSLILTGANSAADLRSDPVPVVYADEVDGYPIDVEGEGNPLMVLIERTGAYAGRKILMTSTPTRKGGNIHHWFLAGDQNEYHLPCPLCKHMQTLVWGADRIKRDELGGVRWPRGYPDQARYQCEKCGDQFEEWKKIDILPRGEWRPTARGNGAEQNIRSYHVGGLIYPYGWPGKKWTNLAAEWEREHAKPLYRRSFVNLKEGLPYDDPAETVSDAKMLFARCEPYGPEVPAEVALLTAGCDVQGNRIEVEVLGWGEGEETWSIDYRVLVGDTARIDGKVWKELDDLLAGEWLSETGLTLGIRAACVDASYQQDLVRKWCGARRNRNIWPVIGRDGQNRPVWPTRAAKPPRPGKPPSAIVLGVDAVKVTVYARLNQLEPGPGYSHFPIGRTLDQFEMLTSEICVPDYSGPIPSWHWKKKHEGVRNEWFDCRNYNHGAKAGLEFTTAFRLDREVEKWKSLTAARAAGKPVVPFVPRRAPAIQVDDPYLS